MLGSSGELPPYRRQKGDRNLAATLAIAKVGFTLLRNPDLDGLDTAQRDAEDWAARCRALEHAAHTALLDWIHTYPPRLAASMQRLLDTGMLGATPRGIVEQLVERREGASPGLVNRIVAGTGDVARPARHAVCGRSVNGGPRPVLGAASTPGSTASPSAPPARTSRPGIDAFLRDHGHAATTSTSWRRWRG